jgi:hypothetical protein
MNKRGWPLAICRMGFLARPGRARKPVLLAILLGLCCLGSVRAEATEPRWLSDWEEGRKAARASGKPLFVVFRCEH